MKSFDEIEDKMRRLDKQQATDPPAFVWDNIEAELDDGKRRRLFFIFLFGMSIFLVLFVAYKSFYFLGNENNNISVSEVEDNAQQLNFNNGKSEILVDSINMDLNELSVNPENVHDEEGTIVINSQVKNSSDDDKRINSNMTSFLNNSNNENRGEIEHDERVKPNDKNFSIDKEATDVMKFNSSNVLSIGNSNNHPAIQNLQDVLLSEIDSSSFISIGDGHEFTAKNILNITSSLQQIRSLQFMVLYNRDIHQLTFKRPNRIEIKKSKSKFSFDLGWSQGMHFAEYDSQLLRPISESAISTSGIKVAFQYDFDNKMSLSLGLDYLSVKDSLNFTIENLVGFLPPEEPNGDSIPIYENTSFKSRNEYKLFDIPIMLGYEFSMKGWRITPSAGLLLNLSSNGSGKVLNFEGEEENRIYFTEETDRYFRMGVGIGVVTSVKILKPIKQNIALFFTPTFKRHIGNLNAEQFANPTRLNVFTTDIGLTYTF